MSPVPGGWRPIVREPFAGAWQKNQEASIEDSLTFPPVFACITLIASDLSKLGIKLHRKAGGIWTEARSRKGRVLSRPNAYQTRAQFIESWLLSKLSRGNAYILKQRGTAGVEELHVLHPDRVTVLVSEMGNVYYELDADLLANIKDGERVVVPASEIIHDRFNCLYHPLVGMSPVVAAALSVSQGIEIQRSSAKFFGNNAMPGGILVAPGPISEETAQRLKAHWEANYSGANAGRVAVVGDNLRFEKLGMAASDSQLIEQLRWTSEIVCSLFHVPPYKIGLGQMPSYNNVQALNQEYYSQCLQRLIKDIQTLLNEGIEVGPDEGFRFDLDALLMMDTQTQVNVLKESVGAALMKPNEGREKLNLPPVEGGDTPYLQQQNYSLAALAKRDAQQNPFGTEPAPAAPPDQTDKALALLWKRAPETLTHV